MAKFFKKRSSFRVPAGFLGGLIFIILASPTPASIITGSVIMIFGEAVRLISAGTLVKAKELTVCGIYACVRNPLYLGSFLLGTGASVISRSIIFSILFFGGFAAIYIPVIRREERFLEETYGEDYKNYCLKVRRLIPGTPENAHLFDPFSMKQVFKNHEHHAVIGMLAVIIISLVKMMLKK